MVSSSSFHRFREAQPLHTTWVRLLLTRPVTGLGYTTHSKVVVALPVIQSAIHLLRPAPLLAAQLAVIPVLVEALILSVRHKLLLLKW
jgi:hypothetical protein